MRKPIAVIITLGCLLGTAALFQNCAEDINLEQYSGGSSGTASASLPRFASAPVNVAVTLLQPINITVSTRGQVDEYIWYRNDVLIPNVTTATLSYPQALESHAGNYRIVIRNSNGDESSANFTVTVTRLPNQIAPAIVTAPLPLTGIHYFFNGADSGVFITGRQAAPFNQATFSVVTQSAEPTTYQWYKVVAGNATPINGATAATLNLMTTSYLDSGTYRVVATNRFGSVMSEAALTITIENINFAF